MELYFNSIKVRLKLAGIEPLQELVNFNSIKVRLKHVIQPITLPAYLFQFHKGTIKTFPAVERSRRDGISIP